jgi:organic radical activating enzyme
MKKLIQIKKQSSSNYRVVDWVIHDVCNYRCSFCSSEYWAGKNRWLELDQYKAIIDNISKQSREIDGKPVWFKITGGEPTLYPKLDQLLAYIKSKGDFTYLHSNGSRTIRWWKEVAELELLDIINLTYHPQQTNDMQHIIDVVQYFQNYPTFVQITVTCPVDFFDEAVIAHNYFLNNLVTLSNLQQINDNLGMSKYTDEQVKILKQGSMKASKDYKMKKMPWKVPTEYTYSNGKMELIYDDHSTEITDAVNVIKRQLDNFNNWNCDIGIEMIRIVSDVVYRGNCKVGESWGVYEPNMFKTEPITCTKSTCTCTLDLIQAKKLISKFDK